MAVKTLKRKKGNELEIISGELKKISKYLAKFLLLIPEESIKEYKNSSDIKKSYLKAIKTFSLN